MKVWEAVWLTAWCAFGGTLGAIGGGLDARGVDDLFTHGLVIAGIFCCAFAFVPYISRKLW